MKNMLKTRMAALLLAVLLAITAMPMDAYAAEDKTWEATGADAVLDIQSKAVAIPKSKGLVAWNFRLHGWSGVGLDGTRLPMEGYYGTEILCDGPRVTYRAYANQKDVKPVSAMVAEIPSGKTVEVPIGLDNKAFNVKKLADGLYALDTTFSTGHASRSWFYVLSGKAYAVDADEGRLETWAGGYDGIAAKKYTAYRNPADADVLLQDWIADQGITPENSLGLDEICYQYWDDGARGRNDTGRWAKLAHDVVPDECASLPDGVKVLLLHDWMTANLSYDKYLAITLDENARKNETMNSMSRNFYYKDHSGKHSVWNTRTGTCVDFSNILAIMCRELGIPCNVMSNGQHAWNLVWLGGRWRVVDVTPDVQRRVYGADASKVENAELTVRYEGFCEPAITKFGVLYSIGTHPYSLDAASVKKYPIVINSHCLYTRDSIKSYLGLSDRARGELRKS